MSDEKTTVEGTGTKKSVHKVEKPRLVTVSVDMGKEEVLRLNQDPAVKLVWDPFAFKELPDDVVRGLTARNMEAYFKAKLEAAARAKEAEAAMKGELEVMSPLEMRAQHRLKIRPRRGWHQAWKAPGADFDAAMAGPYKQVRKPGKDQEEGKVEPGEESGEVLKLYDGEGKVTLIAVECKQELYEQHLEAMARKSARMITGVKDDFYQATEEINRAQTSKGARIIPMDESGNM